MLILIVLLTLMSSLHQVTSSDEHVRQLSRHPRYLVYPPRGAFKLVLGLAVPFPIDVKGKYLAWTINFQFQYALPINVTQLNLPYNVRSSRSLRALDRASVYTSLQSYMDGRGLDGQACLLRSICEAAEAPLQYDGLLGQILQILLTPRIEEEGVGTQLMEARLLGERGTNCGAAYADCSTSVLGLVSHTTQID